VVVVRRALAAIGVAGITTGCNPGFDQTTSIITGPRLLAVQATPPEAATGASFTLSALYVDANGARDASGMDWATCLSPKPLGQPDPVDLSCFVDTASFLVHIGTGSTVQGTIPADACELFGPDSPPPLPGQPSARPVDPDATGGFYLPVRVKTVEGDWSAVRERLECTPSGLTQSVLASFTAGYQPNANPVVAALSVVNADGSLTPIVADGAAGTPPLAVTARQRVLLRAEWPECPADLTTPGGCGGAESYLLVDPTSHQLVTARESIVVSWYATAGAFDVERNGHDDDDPSTVVDDGWTAPSVGGVVHLWVVLRDARGGVGWGSYSVEITP
jgi:hypothetical protein